MKEKHWIDYSIHAVGIAVLAIIILIGTLSRRYLLRAPVDWDTIAAFELFADTAFASSADASHEAALAGAKSGARSRTKNWEKSGIKEKKGALTETKTEVKSGAREAQGAAAPDSVKQAWKDFKPQQNYAFEIELNTADSSDLVQLRGIGAYYAKKILEYREKLGGFVQVEQLLEISGIDSVRLVQFYGNVRVNAQLAASLDLKTASVDVLSAHPYIGKYAAKSIALWREMSGSSACTLEQLQIQGILKPQVCAKLRPYCKTP